ncbi:MAG: hypothetical protein NC092_05140, partial [Butyrivibrio sp.]|nr:hypothetical protein [Butyrivibrio sp.]
NCNTLPRTIRKHPTAASPKNIPGLLPPPRAINGYRFKYIYLASRANTKIATMNKLRKLR